MREFVVQANLLLKLTIRSLVSCIRLPNAQLVFFNTIYPMMSLVEVVQNTTDRELIANSLKVIRISIKSDQNMDFITGSFANLVNKVVEILPQHLESKYIVREVVQIVQRFIDVEEILHQRQGGATNRAPMIYISDASIRVLVTSGLGKDFRIPQGGLTEQKWYRV